MAKYNVLVFTRDHDLKSRINELVKGKECPTINQESVRYIDDQFALDSELERQCYDMVVFDYDSSHERRDIFTVNFSQKNYVVPLIFLSDQEITQSDIVLKHGAVIKLNKSDTEKMGNEIVETVKNYYSRLPGIRITNSENADIEHLIESLTSARLRAVVDDSHDYSNPYTNNKPSINLEGVDSEFLDFITDSIETPNKTKNLTELVDDAWVINRVSDLARALDKKHWSHIPNYVRQSRRYKRDSIIFEHTIEVKDENLGSAANELGCTVDDIHRVREESPFLTYVCVTLGGGRAAYDEIQKVFDSPEIIKKIPSLDFITPFEIHAYAHSRDHYRNMARQRKTDALRTCEVLMDNDPAGGSLFRRERRVDVESWNPTFILEYPLLENENIALFVKVNENTKDGKKYSWNEMNAAWSMFINSQYKKVDTTMHLLYMGLDNAIIYGRALKKEAGNIQLLNVLGYGDQLLGMNALQEIGIYLNEMKNAPIPITDEDFIHKRNSTTITEKDLLKEVMKVITRRQGLSVEAGVIIPDIYITHDLGFEHRVSHVSERFINPIFSIGLEGLAMGEEEMLRGILPAHLALAADVENYQKIGSLDSNLKNMVNNFVFDSEKIKRETPIVEFSLGINPLDIALQDIQLTGEDIEDIVKGHECVTFRGKGLPVKYLMKQFGIGEDGEFQIDALNYARKLFYFLWNKEVANQDSSVFNCEKTVKEIFERTIKTESCGFREVGCSFLEEISKLPCESVQEYFRLIKLKVDDYDNRELNRISRTVMRYVTYIQLMDLYKNHEEGEVENVKMNMMRDVILNELRYVPGAWGFYLNSGGKIFENIEAVVDNLEGNQSLNYYFEKINDALVSANRGAVINKVDQIFDYMDKLYSARPRKKINSYESFIQDPNDILKVESIFLAYLDFGILSKSAEEKGRHVTFLQNFVNYITFRMTEVTNNHPSRMVELGHHLERNLPNFNESYISDLGLDKGVLEKPLGTHFDLACSNMMALNNAFRNGSGTIREYLNKGEVKLALRQLYWPQNPLTSR